jgi:hypothetical protein
MPSFNIPANERPIVELAVGSAVMDKVRGHQASLVDAYAKAGGTDPDSKKQLAQHEAALAGVGQQKLGAMLSGGKTFKAEYTGWDIPNAEENIIERSVGAAILNKIEGKGPTKILEAYQSAGGNNPTTLEELAKIPSK